MGTAKKARRLLAIWPALLLLVVVADLFGTALARSSARVVGKKQWEFDYFVLSLQWPGTIYAFIRHCCATNGCCRYSPSPPSVS
ncbi:hypothetical protein E2562_000327 [Oryza meyeriana var. granulata]|uniref:Uncharacterized protein n=1 Tax=Oryza meyeriana var. granulata TaxID=110450 RepID=A0A6G1CMS8_9ORYZ|nr:hypothetical protein E2562_000327 [Oryza meyeriana var. granulata]